MNQSRAWVVVGGQWGDEGKGKVVDWLASRVDAVVRFQGGHNAGHTLWVGSKKFVLQLVPSGILYPKTRCFIGNGVVVSPHALCNEIKALERQNVNVWPRIQISDRAPVLLPSHVALDRAREAALGEAAIGTTSRGIGPAYEDKIARRGLRMADLRLPERDLRDKVEQLIKYHRFLLTAYPDTTPVDFDDVWSELQAAQPHLLPLLADVGEALWQVQQEGGSIVFEGAQGAMLDLDHGTYPYVTSSNTMAGAAALGTGMPPGAHCHVMAVIKAYVTRVGAGPMLTEQLDDAGVHMAEQGREWGAVTGRARRCGWLDAVALRYAARLGGWTELAVTKMDVLEGLETVKIAVGYQRHGELVGSFPATQQAYHDLEPVYETLPGWPVGSIAGVKRFQDLPVEAQGYLQRVAEHVGIPVRCVSTGPTRSAMLAIDDPHPSRAPLS